MSLTNFYYNKEADKLCWAYFRRAFFRKQREYGLAKQRLVKLFGFSLEQRILDAVWFKGRGE